MSNFFTDCFRYSGSGSIFWRICAIPKKLYGENDKWPKEITYLLYKEDDLTTKEKLYISKTLKIKALRLFLNLRYPTDPVRYNSMNKDQLIKELKYKRYD